MGRVKDFIHTCYFVSFLVFKSAKATEPLVLTKWEDNLSSPNYPFTYPANSTLTWIKTVSTGNRITITIYDFQTQCDGDYLEIRDGDSIASPMLARFCGNSGTLLSISSSGSHMLLRFVSDNVTESSNSRGFHLRHSGVCKVQTNATSGVITTPKYPGDYLNYMDCLWTIKLHPSMFIALECHDIALEYIEGCKFDYMEILAGVSLDAPVLGRYCGVYNHSLTFERDGNISIRFVSDQDKELSGFRCAYNVDKVRGGWTAWTTWTACSQTCHHGNRSRYRTCSNPLPESGLELVCGDVADTEMRSCLISNCTPVDGGYSSWSSWSACNVSSGAGFRNRSRSCTDPPPAFTGKNCSEIGVPWETSECVLASCLGPTSVALISSLPSNSASPYHVMLQSLVTATLSLNSSIQLLATSLSSNSSAALSSSNSSAVSALGESHATSSSKYSFFTPITRPSSTISSSINILLSSSTPYVRNKTTSNVQALHATKSQSTLTALQTSNKSILSERTIFSANIPSSNMHSTDVVRKITSSCLSYSSTPLHVSTEPLTLNSKLLSYPTSSAGQTGQQNEEISSAASLFSRTVFESFNSQIALAATTTKISSSYLINSSTLWHVFTEPLTSESQLFRGSISTVVLTGQHITVVSSTNLHAVSLLSKAIYKTLNFQLDSTSNASSRYLSNSSTPTQAFTKPLTLNSKSLRDFISTVEQTGQSLVGISTFLSGTVSASYTSTYLSNFSTFSQVSTDSISATGQTRQSVVGNSSFNLYAVSLVSPTISASYSYKEDPTTINTKISSSFLSHSITPLHNKATEDSQAIHVTTTYSTLGGFQTLSNSILHDSTIFSANVSNTKVDSAADNGKISSLYLSYSSTTRHVSTETFIIRDSNSKVRQTGQHILGTSRTVSSLSSPILENYISHAVQGHRVTSLKRSVTNLHSSSSNSVGMVFFKSTDWQVSQQFAWSDPSNGITLHTPSTRASSESHQDNLELSRRTKTLQTKVDHGATGSIAHVTITWATLPTSTNWKLHYNKTQESSILRNHTRRTLAQSTRILSESGYYQNSSRRRSSSTAESTLQSTWRPNIDEDSVYPTTTNYAKTSSQSSIMLLPSTYHTIEVPSIRSIQTLNGMLTTKFGQYSHQAGNYHRNVQHSISEKGSSSPLMIAASQTFPLPLTQKTIIPPDQNQSKTTRSYTINIPETMHSNFKASQSSSLNTPQNGLTPSLDVTRSSKHTFTLATERAILDSNAPFSGDAIRSSDHTFSPSTVIVISYSNVAFRPSDKQNTEMAYTLRTPMIKTISGSHVGVPSSHSESHQVNLVTSWERKAEETKTDHGQTETVPSLHATATWATTVCCETSSTYRPRAPGSSVHQANRESTRPTELLPMIPAQETSYFRASFDRTAGSEVDETDTKTSSNEQSPLSTSQVRATLLRLSYTISPSSTAPSSPVVVSITSTLEFPWHLIPFVVILFLTLTALVTYCLRIPDITEKIFLAIREMKKQIKMSRPERSFNLTKGDVFKSFEASTFHSYQRELFYDATLNYAMFEHSTTKTIEFSVHLQGEEQSVGAEESVEISCEMEEEPANEKQRSDSLSEMFDYSSSEAVRSRAKKTAHWNDSSTCYDI